MQARKHASAQPFAPPTPTLPGYRSHETPGNNGPHMRQRKQVTARLEPSRVVPRGYLDKKDTAMYKSIHQDVLHLLDRSTTMHGTRG